MLKSLPPRRQRSRALQRRAPVRRRHRSEEEASRALLLPGNPRELGLREAISEPFFYSKMFNPRWRNTPDEIPLETRVDVERLRMEIVLVIHGRDGYPRSIRGWRNPERHDGRPRSVRGQMKPEYRELRLNQRRGKTLFLFKPV